MDFSLSDFTKNNYKTPQRPVQELLVELGWSWSNAGRVANEYSQFEVEEAIRKAREQSVKQGKNLVTVAYVAAILRNKPYNGKTIYK